MPRDGASVWMRGCAVTCRLCGKAKVPPASCSIWRDDLARRAISGAFLTTQRGGEAQEGRDDRPRGREACDRVARDFGDARDAPSLPDRNFERGETAGGDAHQHLQIPAIGRLTHAESTYGWNLE